MKHFCIATVAKCSRRLVSAKIHYTERITELRAGSSPSLKAQFNYSSIQVASVHGVCGGGTAFLGSPLIGYNNLRPIYIHVYYTYLFLY